MSSPEGGLRLDLTPLIDVVFLVLVVFLVATRNMAPQWVREMSLPAAAGASSDQSRRPKLVLSASKELRLEGEILGLAEALDRLEPGRGLVFAADEHLPYGQVAEVLFALQDRGIDDLALEVAPRSGEATSAP